MVMTAESLGLQLTEDDETPNRHLDILLTKNELANVISNLYLDKYINDDTLRNLSILISDRISADGELNLGYLIVKFFLCELI